MQISRVLSFPLLLAVLSIPQLLSSPPSQCQADRVALLPNIAALQARSTAIPVQVLVQSPAETTTELQIICVFQSAPENTLHGSLVEINQKLQGLLEQIRNPALFRGDLGETLLITPSTGNLAAKNLLLIGLGDSETSLRNAWNSSARSPIANPSASIFATHISHPRSSMVAWRATRPEKYHQAFMTGFLRAARTERVLVGVGASAQEIVQNLTFLAGAAHASDTKQGIEAALATNGKQ